MQVCGDIMGPRSLESFQGPLAKRWVQLSISFGGISLFFTEDCAPSTFLRNWALVASYFCLRFRIFDRTIWEEHDSQVERGPHLL